MTRAAGAPWTRLHASNEAPGDSLNTTQLGWSKYDVPYQNPHNTLQTLDVHIPTTTDDTTSDPSSHVARQGIWTIFIHGGAWRDPKVTSRSVLPTVRRLFADPKYAQSLSHVAGVASLNYSLSSHPNYPPGSAPDDAYDTDKDAPGSRTAKHPQHIHDVKTAISFLVSEYNVQKYIVVGHSCGATLAFQTIMPQAWGPETTAGATVGGNFPTPSAIAGIAGLYDLPGLVHSPGERYEWLVTIYRDFLIGAFGPDEGLWEKVSPSNTRDPATAWPSGKLVVLSASKDDTLVPYVQLTGLQARLQELWSGAGIHGQGQQDNRKLLIEHFKGDHNDAWEDGTGVADVISRLSETLAAPPL